MTNPAVDYSSFGRPGFPVKMGTKEQQVYQQPGVNEDEEDFSSLGRRATDAQEFSEEDKKSFFNYLTPLGQKFKEKYLTPKEGISSEGKGKSILRTLLQVPTGLFQKYTAPLEMLQPGVIQESLDDIEEYALRHNLSEEEYNKLVEGIYEGANYLGSQSQVENYIEEKTGLPLTPHTRGQELLRLGSFAKGIAPTKASSYAASAGAPALSETLREAGLNEEASDMLALLATGAGIGIGKSAKFKKGAKATGEAISTAAKDIKSSISEGGKPPPPLGGREKRLTKPQKIERFAVPEEIPPGKRSSFEVADRILQNLKQERESQTPQEFSYPRPQKQNANPPPLQDRVTREYADGITQRPTPTRKPTNNESFTQSVLNDVSPYEVTNKLENGTAVKNEVLRVNDEVYSHINDLYNISRELNQGIESVHPELVNYLNREIQRLLQIPDRGSVSNRLLNSMTNIRNRLALVDEEGGVTGYLPISNQDLIAQIQELHQLVDFDFGEGRPKNVFRPLIRNMRQSVERTAAINGAEEAVNSLRRANQAYAEWANTFDNDLITPFRDLSNTEFEKLHDKSLRPADFRALSNILSQSTEGRRLLGSLQREIVDKSLSSYFDNMRNINSRSFNRSLNELTGIIGEEGVNNIRNQFIDYSRRLPNQARILKRYPEETSKTTNAVAKVTNLTPEQIEAKFNTRSGIREMRERLNKTDRQRQLFKEYQDQKILDILYEGEVKKSPTGTDLKRVINNKKNYELLREFVGEREAAALRHAAEALGDRTFSPENINKFAKTVGKIILKGKIYKLLKALPL